MPTTSSPTWHVDWARAAAAAYAAGEPADKLVLVAALPRPDSALPEPWRLPLEPGRPDQPVLIDPARVAKRKLGSAAGRIALLHAIAHIEFNAINLALDASLRFAAMPLEYYQDWISVAQDEARHFQLLATRLGELKAVYGQLPAHDGLWEMARKTQHDVLLRMALVPRVLEARGLDVTPGMIARLESAADQDSAAILRTILREEVRHVAIGSRWFAWLCQRRQLAPQRHFLQLLAEHLPQRKVGVGPLNHDARRAAGFGVDELAGL